MAVGFCLLAGAVVWGAVTFTEQGDNQIRVQGTIRGLTPGSHGFHIHQLGDVSTGCGAAGGHFNPENEDHGSPDDDERHVGDLGNIVADSDGVAQLDFTDSVIALTGDNGILGRSVVVHAGQDDLGRGGNEGSRKTGNAGGRVACGTINTFPY